MHVILSELQYTRAHIFAKVQFVLWCLFQISILLSHSLTALYVSIPMDVSENWIVVWLVGPNPLNGYNMIYIYNNHCCFSNSTELHT